MNTIKSFSLSDYLTKDLFNFKTWLWAIIAGIYFYLIITIPYDFRNEINTVHIHNTDEWNALFNLKKCLDRGFFTQLNFYSYGSLNSLLPFLFIDNIKNTLPINANTITLIYRFVSLVFSFISIYYLYLIAYRLFKLTNYQCLIVILFPFAFYEFWLYSIIIHPDTMLLAFMLMAFYHVSISENRLWGYIFGTVFIGLAVSTKIYGILGFAYVAGAVLYDQNILWSNNKNFLSLSKNWLHTLLILGSSLVLVIFIFSTTNYWAVSDLKDFLDAMKWESSDKSFKPREMFLIHKNGAWNWFGIITKDSNFFIGILFYSALLIFLLKYGKELYRAVVSQAIFSNRNLFILGSFILSAVLYAVLLIKYRESRYIFPFSIYGGLFVALVIESLIRRNYYFRYTSYAIIVLITLSALANVKRLNSYFTLNLSAIDTEVKFFNDASKIVDFNQYNWIFKDAYCYLPDIYNKKRMLGFTLSEEMVKNNNIDLIICSKDHSGRWLWKEPGTSVLEGKWEAGTTASEIDIKRVKQLWSYLLKNNYEVIFENEFLIYFGLKVRQNES